MQTFLNMLPTIILIIFVLSVLITYKIKANNITVVPVTKTTVDTLVTQLLTLQGNYNELLEKYNKLVLVNADDGLIYKPIVLGIWPNVPEAAKLNIKSEIDAIFNSGFDYTEITDVTRQTLVDEVRRKEYIIAHIGAHASREGILISGNDILRPGWWAKLFEDSTIYIVVLLACESLEISDALYDAGIDYVIGIRSQIADSEAVKFAETFYKQLRREFIEHGKGASIEKAFATAQLVVSTEYANMITLRHRGQR